MTPDWIHKVFLLDMVNTLKCESELKEDEHKIVLEWFKRILIDEIENL